MVAPDDPVLLTRAAAGDETAFAALVRSYSALLAAVHR